MLPEFDLLRPKTLPEALAMLAGGNALPIAGGTNVVVDLRAGRGGITPPGGDRAGQPRPYAHWSTSPGWPSCAACGERMATW